jgi:hypothetical protein
MISVQTGIPRSLGDWFMHCTEGFIPVALTLAGAKDDRVRCAGAPGATQRASQELVDVTVDVSWS